MLKQRKWGIFFAMFLLAFALEVITTETITAAAGETVMKRTVGKTKVCETVPEEEAPVVLEISTEAIWKRAYFDLMYGEENAELRKEIEETEKLDLELMTSATDHIVSYHGNRFAITDDEYQVLLKIVEAEAPDEDIRGKILVANVVLNRLEVGFCGDTISEVVFARNQFEPIGNGSIFRVTPSESTIEAVERALKGEDFSQGALYFMARAKASYSGIQWFDANLKFLFKHGGHEFFTEKD